MKFCALIIYTPLKVKVFTVNCDFQSQSEFISGAEKKVRPVSSKNYTPSPILLKSFHDDGKGDYKEIGKDMGIWALIKSFVNLPLWNQL